ncbi:hypothetical protein B0H16DRAFT_1702243 [Mycena metata]|uniref:Uncharacterized protein n=1 Tax=Mycena metata TaxID=1033252 RepID=A0AAD7H6W9_9AGAR|nr:hypothetical protein B0H16DRAFT_1702243 [Mycena metata]
MSRREGGEVVEGRKKSVRAVTTQSGRINLVEGGGAGHFAGRQSPNFLGTSVLGTRVCLLAREKSPTRTFELASYAHMPWRTLGIAAFCCLRATSLRFAASDRSQRVSNDALISLVELSSSASSLVSRRFCFLPLSDDSDGVLLSNAGYNKDAIGDNKASLRSATPAKSSAFATTTERRPSKLTLRKSLHDTPRRSPRFLKQGTPEPRRPSGNLGICYNALQRHYKHAPFDNVHNIHIFHKRHKAVLNSADDKKLTAIAHENDVLHAPRSRRRPVTVER